MANPRKVQTEIDKLLKKVTEGIDIYEGVYDKVCHAADRVQKEKFEADLKKEIKKLQRLRETVKGLIASPEVKNKSDLEKARRSVEIKMESFKVCERETKTKAFSKEGLAAGVKLDPAEKAKIHTCGWLRSALSDLQEQNEQLEYDIENEPAPAPKKKGKQVEDPRETRLTRSKFHMLKMEQLLRLIESNDMAPGDVDSIEDEIGAYVEGFRDQHFEEDDPDLYDQFDLPDCAPESDDDDDAPPPAVAAPKKEEKKDDKKSAGGVVVEHRKDTPPTAAKKEAPKAADKKKDTPKTVTAKDPPKVAAVIKTPVTVPAAKAPLASPPAGVTMAAMLRGSTSSTGPGASGSNANTSASQGSPMPEEMLLGDDDEDAFNDDTFGDDAMEGVGGAQSGGLADMASMTQALGGEWQKGPPPGSAAPKPPSFAEAAKVGTAAAKPAAAPAAEPKAAAAPAPAVAPEPAAASAPSVPSPAPSVVDPVVSRMLEMSLKNLPHVGDCERLKPYTPPNPCSTPEYYPQTVHPTFSNPETFSRFDPDTLFFVFYYQQATYHSYLAAKELKRQAWRYHKKFSTWFQRHDKPKSTTEEQEQGTYVYFDFESGWCQRIKTDFIFRYQHLEDELQP